MLFEHGGRQIYIVCFISDRHILQRDEARRSESHLTTGTARHGGRCSKTQREKVLIWRGYAVVRLNVHLICLTSARYPVVSPAHVTPELDGWTAGSPDPVWWRYHYPPLNGQVYPKSGRIITTTYIYIFFAVMFTRSLLLIFCLFAYFREVRKLFGILILHQRITTGRRY